MPPTVWFGVTPIIREAPAAKIYLKLSRAIHFTNERAVLLLALDLSSSSASSLCFLSTTIPRRGTQCRAVVASTGWPRTQKTWSGLTARGGKKRPRAGAWTAGSRL